MNQNNDIPEPNVGVFYSISSWFSILILHALLHLWMAGKYKQHHDLEMTTMSTNDLQEIPECRAQQKAFDSFSQKDLSESASSFDGNEPRIFYELLSQTGSEMATTYSRENLVREQLQVFY